MEPAGGSVTLFPMRGPAARRRTDRYPPNTRPPLAYRLLGERADATPTDPHARDPHAYLAVGTHYCPTYVYFFDLMVEFAMSWSDYQSYVVPTWRPLRADIA